MFLDGSCHGSSYAGGIAITMAYGIDVKSSNDPYIKVSEYAISLVNHASSPGKYLVDAIPWLKYVPEWFPGAQFKRDAKEWYKVAMDYREVPFQATKRDIVCFIRYCAVVALIMRI